MSGRNDWAQWKPGLNKSKQNRRHHAEPCRRCDGLGTVGDELCPSCHGSAVAR